MAVFTATDVRGIVVNPSASTGNGYDASGVRYTVDVDFTLIPQPSGGYFAVPGATLALTITGEGLTYVESSRLGGPTLITGGTVTGYEETDAHGRALLTASGVPTFQGGATLSFLQDLVVSGDDDVTGSSFGDDLGGGAGGDFVRGLAGADTIRGGVGSDTLNGNQGDDLVDAGSDNDTLYGGQGSDTLHADDGDDGYVNGNLGDDVVYGDAGNDTLYGGQGNDHLYGDTGNTGGNNPTGNDLLSGDLGNDTLTGGGGADRFAFRPGSGQDVVTDFNAAEGDRVQLPTGIAYTLTTVNGAAVIDLGHGDTLTLLGVAQASADWIVFA